MSPLIICCLALRICINSNSEEKEEKKELEELMRKKRRKIK
jgi:hypothetical protein